jgi:hypothetical protein
VWSLIVGPNHVVSLLLHIVILKGLKQLTFKGYRAWDVCEDKITMFSPRVYDCFFFLGLNVNYAHLKLMDAY